MSTLLPAGSLPTLLERAADPCGFARWHEQARATGFCSHPVRLCGSTATVDGETGEVLASYATAGEPDGTLLVACGNRRVTRCPSCAETYRQDSFHLIAAGLRGGKGIPESVASHPRVFLTLTAPSFGAVHTTRDDGEVCHRRRSGDRCPHGVTRGCWRRHGADDEVLGQPVCTLCFEYDRAVLWNAVAPELWRRTTIAIRRQLAKVADIRVRQLNEHVRLRFTKVIEYQARGAVHVHAVLRLDGPDPDVVRAPGPGWTVELLEEAIRRAVAEVSAPMPGRDLEPDERAVWGTQVDLRPLPGSDGTEESVEHLRGVAAYIAKYATKSTDSLGSLDRRLLHGEQIDDLDINDHQRELVETAWQLGAEPHLADLKLRHWSHTLGYRGHWATRSRRYSTTLTALRETRRRWRAVMAGALPAVKGEATAVVAIWTYAGSGYRTPGDAWLARTAQQRQLEAKRERRALARQTKTTKGDDHGEALAHPG